MLKRSIRALKREAVSTVSRYRHLAAVLPCLLGLSPPIQHSTFVYMHHFNCSLRIKKHLPFNERQLI